MEDSGLESVIKVLFFLLFVGGGVIADILKKNKERRRVEKDIENADKPSLGAASRQYPNTAIKTQPQKKPAAKPKARADDPEWLATLADRKRREVAKALEKLPPFEEENSPINDDPAPPAYTPPRPAFTLSAQQAREGIILAEILGPPVSLR